MALDPEDPLIPLPWQMGQIRAYRAQKAIEAEQDRMKMEERALDLAAKRRKQEMESPSGRATTAAEVTARLEQMTQEEEGVRIGGEIGKRMVEKGGPSILEATKIQGKMDVESRAREAYKNALSEYLVRESLVPSAKVDVGGMTATVPFQSAGERMSDVYGQIYSNMVPRVERTFIDQGYAPEEARRMAIERVSNELQKASSSGKVVVSSADGLSTISYSNEQAMRMWKDPNTPKTIRDQLNGFFGQQETPKASTWINTRLGR